jgi:ethanolamine permease
MSLGLKKTLSPILLWGLGVGYVISGMYFGWNLGLEKGGTFGMLSATILVIVMYVCFSFSYCELACAIPKAGGGFDYANRALGMDVGFITGLAQIIEFVFAPPAIAIAIGTYLHLSFPTIPVLTSAFAVYIIFTALNIYGVKAAATFELIVTVLAVAELLLFSGVTLPHFSKSAFVENASFGGWEGAFAAIPFAIWFFLGIEGVANVAEETSNPQKDILKGFGSAMITLVFLCILVFIASIGVAGWEKVVFNDDGSASDSPLPLAMALVVNTDSWLFHMLISIGLFGLIASFHGLILASGRATMEFGKVGFAPKFLSKISSKFRTPHIALIVNMLLGFFALLTGKTAEIITISVFGALTLYIISMISVIKLRNSEPELIRPFKVPFYPLLPFLALLIGVICLISMTYFNFVLASIYFGVILVCFLLFKILYKPLIA